MAIGGSGGFFSSSGGLEARGLGWGGRGGDEGPNWGGAAADGWPDGGRRRLDDPAGERTRGREEREKGEEEKERKWVGPPPQNRSILLNNLNPKNKTPRKNNTRIKITFY